MPCNNVYSDIANKEWFFFRSSSVLFIQKGNFLVSQDNGALCGARLVDPNELLFFLAFPHFITPALIRIELLCLCVFLHITASVSDKVDTVSQFTYSAAQRRLGQDFVSNCLLRHE